MLVVQHQTCVCESINGTVVQVVTTHARTRRTCDPFSQIQALHDLAEYTKSQLPSTVPCPVQVRAVSEIHEELSCATVWVFPARHGDGAALVREIEF